MAIIALKAWYLSKYEPLQELEKRQHDLRLSKNSLLKSALRADFLEDSAEIKKSGWFQRYLDGEIVEFYIEGSGGYMIANIDLSSHEIYFIKQTTVAQMEPTIFLCHHEYGDSSQILREALNKVLENLNKRSRFPITLTESPRPGNSPMRLSSTATRKIRKCLLFIADGTPIAQVEGKNAQLILSPSVCVEIGYAVTSKRAEQILIAQRSQLQLSGQYPFELPSYQSLLFNDSAELDKVLPQVIETQLKRFNLFS